MPRRNIPFAPEEIYHIFNRGAGRQPIFENKKDYERFILSFSYYQQINPPFKLSRFLTLAQEEREKLFYQQNPQDKLVDILSFVLMPNHFHLILRERKENGISTFLRRFTNSYIRYFNTKRKKSGALFQGMFKAVHIETEEQLLHLSRYIHLNPLVSYVVKEKDFLSYPWSSLPDYLSGKSTILELETILSHFKNPEAYKKFVLDQKDYAKELEKIKHLLLEK